MISTILTILASSFQSYIQPEMLSRYDFVLVTVNDEKRHKARRTTDQSELRWKVRASDPTEVAKEITPHMQASLDTSRFGFSRSGIPLGSRNSWAGDASKGVLTVRAGGTYELVRLEILGAVQQSGRSKWFAQVNPQTVEPIMEILCRDLLGSYGARRLLLDGNVSVSGRSYPAMKASGTNARFIDLAAWANANSLTVSTGQDGTVKSFTKGGTLWIVPLASNKIKKGSVWQILPDIVMQKDGKFMIPITALAN